MLVEWCGICGKWLDFTNKPGLHPVDNVPQLPEVLRHKKKVTRGNNLLYFQAFMSTQKNNKTGKILSHGHIRKFKDRCVAFSFVKARGTIFCLLVWFVLLFGVLFVFSLLFGLLLLFAFGVLFVFGSHRLKLQTNSKHQ